MALPQWVASVFQLFAVRLVRWTGSRLNFLVYGACLQGSLLLPAAFLSLAPIRLRVEPLVGLIVGFRILGNLIGTAWGSLVSDYLPETKRGHYLGWRSQIVGLAGVVGVGLAGLLPLSFFLSHDPDGGHSAFTRAGQ